MAPAIRRLVAPTNAPAPTTPFLREARGPRSVDRPALASAAATWAGELDARGVPAGARVALDIDDPLAFAVAHLSVIAAGRCSAPTDPAAPPAEAARTRAVLRPALVLTDRDDRAGLRVDPATALPRELHTPPRRVARPGPASSTSAAGSVVLLTSGSTGTPKAVELSEPQLLHVAHAVARHHGLTAADRGYCPLPLFHVNAQVVALLATLVAGGELVLDRRFHRTGFWPLMRELDVTWINAAPAIITILTLDDGPPVHVPRLRFVRSASAALAPRVRTLFEERTGAAVVESYGMTEAASQITATPLDEPHRPGSAGKPVDVELRIVAGRVQIRGSGVITSYVGGVAADRFDEGGWLDTGDLGRLDEDGWLHLDGRADDVVNRGGELVHPQEIEAVLLAEADVTAAVVVGRPDEVLGAVPVAFVRADGNDPGLVDRLGRRCVRELAVHKRPASIELVETLPLGPTGKVRRAALRAELAAR